MKRRVMLLAAPAAFWVNFARTGNPNSDGLPHWPAFGDAGKAQLLGNTVATESSSTLSSAKQTFFDSAYQQLQQGGANR